MVERERIGDRVERRIQQHADAEQEIKHGEAQESRLGPRIRRTAFWLVVTGVSLYLVAPTLLETLGSWASLQQIGLYWFPVMAVLQGASLACLWELQRLALRMRAWRPVIASQLAGNALAKVAPGGGAIGAALQYRMLVQAGVRQAEAVSALTAVNLLTFAIVLALPVFAIPTFIRGSVSRSLIEATVVGLLVFLVVAGVAAVCLALDGPLAWVGRTVQRARNRMRRGSPPTTGLPDRLLRERDRILATLGPRWKRAVLAAVGRWAFDYATLLAALAAVGSTPRAGLVLLAFCAAQMLAQIPLTPGGLGFVEAGLTATLALAGVGAGDAVLATFAYRLFSYWLPLPLGLVGVGLQRRYASLAVGRPG
jgi:uncharacterized protein (TIRG00374 family)